MRQCRQCFEFKPDTGPLREFSPKQGRCFKCRMEHRKRKRLERAGEPVPLPSRVFPAFNHVRQLFRAIDTGREALPLDVPVRVRGRAIPAPMACAIRLCDTGNGMEAWIYMASQRGSKQLQYASTAPEALIYALEALGLELILPTDAVLGDEKRSANEAIARERPE